MTHTFDYSKLKGKIIEKYGTQAAFANAIGMSNPHFSQKMNNLYGFSQDEIRVMSDTLAIPNKEIGSYFFALKI